MKKEPKGLCGQQRDDNYVIFILVGVAMGRFVSHARHSGLFSTWVKIKGGNCEGGNWDSVDLVDLVNLFNSAEIY